MQPAAVFERRQAGRFLFEVIDSGNIAEITAFQQWWMDENTADNKSAESLAFENQAIYEALSNWDSLGMFGLCIRLDGKIAGYALTAAQTEDYATGHI